MRKLITATALMAFVQGAAAAGPAALPDPSYDPALREIAMLFDGAGLRAVSLGGRPIAAGGLMLAQQRSTGSIDTTPTDPNAPDPTMQPQPAGTIGTDPPPATTTTTTTTAARTTSPTYGRWYDPTWVKVVVGVVAVIGVAILASTLGDDDDEAPAPTGTGGT